MDHLKGLIRVGIPQGTAISAFLANLYLLDFDIAMHNNLKNVNGLYRRYSDDIICVCQSQFEDQIKKSVENEISKYKLKLNEKVEIVRFPCSKTEYLKYLGFQFNGENIYVKPSSISKFYRRAKRLIRYKAYCGFRSKRKKTTIHNHIYRKKIYRKYSHLGKRNFLGYIYRSSGTLKSIAIKKQLQRHWINLNKYIEKWSDKYKLTMR